MKKICIVTTISLTLKSFVVEAVKYLHQNNGYDITLICDEDKEFAESLPEYIHYIPVSMKRGISLSGFSSMRELKKIFKREKFDMVQYSTPNAAMYASMAAKKAKVPVRLYCQWGIVYVAQKGIKRKIFKFMEKTICKKSTHVQPDSHANLEFCINEGLYDKKKGDVIWNGSAKGVNLDRFQIDKKQEFAKEIREKYDIAQDDKVVGFVGRFGKEKGCEELVRAYKKVKETIPNLKLLFVGKIEKVETIDEELFDYFMNEKDIIKTGPVSTVPMHLSAMDVFALPSYREGFGLSVVEAEAMGVPVVVTEFPGPDSAIKDNETGLVVKMQDVDSLADAITKILSDDEFAKKLGEEGRRFIETCFEEQKFFEKLAENRKSILGE